MHLSQWGMRLALAVVLLGVLACRTFDVFIAQATLTPTPTRTVRPTFTPVPPDTSTPVPTNTRVVPTKAPPAPTRRPATARPPTPKPATAAPVVVQQPTQPPKPAYEFSLIPASCPSSDPDGPCNVQGGGVQCHHSGSKHIKVLVFNDVHDPNSQRQNGKVRFSLSPDGTPLDPDEVNQWNGVAEKTLSADQDAPSKGNGTYYAWVIDDNGKRISDMSPAIVLNDRPAEDSAMCTVAMVIFAGGR